MQERYSALEIRHRIEDPPHHHVSADKHGSTDKPFARTLRGLRNEVGP